MSGHVALLAAIPFRIRRRVNWGDCDPAGVVYTPRFSDYVVETYLEFSAQLLGSPLNDTLKALDLSLPAKAMSMEFKRSLWPDEYFDIVVRVEAIRTRTFDLSIRATTPEGTPVFDATLSPICVRPATRESCPIPESLRSKLESYRDTAS
jgi:acyl-CoA thioesterase FadM